jgi:SAM-dependent methyltransferase
MNPEAFKNIKLKRVGSVSPHSSIDYDSNGKVIRSRKPDDIIAEHLPRFEIDRGLDAVEKMKDESGKFLMEIIFDKYRSQGNVAVLDAGCGSGRTLHEIRDRLTFWAKATPESVTTVGVNDIDYSEESVDPKTRAAIKNGEIPYTVDDLAIVKLPAQAFDIVFANEVITRNTIGNAAKIIDNLLTTLKLGGVFIFDISEPQWENHKLRDYFDGLVNGYKLYGYAEYKERSNDKRIFIAIQPR